MSELLERLDREPAGISYRAPTNNPQPVVAPLDTALTPAARVGIRDERQSREQADAARLARKELLRQQLRTLRVEEAAKARLAREEASRKPAHKQVTRSASTEQAPTAAEVAESTQRPLLRDRFLRGDGEGPELAVLPAGRFLMGSTPTERHAALEAGARKAWLERETPQHWVNIEREFAISRHPVTVGQWRALRWRPSGRRVATSVGRPRALYRTTATRW